MSATSAQRRHAIVSMTREQGRVEVVELAERLGVAPETVRRDLTLLERQGLVRRTHGGVYPLDQAGFESSLEYRANHMVPEKRRIAEAAVAQIGGAESIFLDDGFTPRLVAEVLAATERPLTIVTPSIPLAISIATAPRLSVIVLGGRVRPQTLGTAGPWGIEALGSLVIDVAVLGTNGISPERGLTTPSPEVSSGKAQVLRRSRRRIFVGVHTKFGIDSFARFAGVEDFEALITDRGLPGHQVQRYSAAGPRVVRV